MNCNQVARPLAAIFAAALIGMNFVIPNLAKSSLPGDAIAAKETPICDRDNVCFPPPV
jgi:putative lipase involved disintegration of autophagic bodies